MTRLWDRLIGRDSTRDLDDELQWSSLVSSYGTPDQERILPQFEQFAAQAFAGNSIVYALVSRRISLFSEAVFKYRSLADKHLFGTPGLEKLENPWPNGSTGEMLARMEQDSSLAGNSYIRDAGSRLERLRPDWVTIVSWVTEDEHGRKVRDVIGYLFEPVGDPDRGTEFYPVEEVVHWSPMPDPLANFRGMSWLTPVIRDINADVAMTAHREAFFRNAATPNMIIKYQQKLAPTQRDQIRDAIAARHAGNRNAFGTMVLDQGADMTVVGDRMQGSAFSDLQAAGEVRLAAAAGVPAIVAGLSQGRQTGAPGEYADAVRGFVDLTIRPNWRTVCSSLTKFAPPPPGSQLWFDTTDISALRQGEKDAADTMQVQAGTTNTLIMAGYEPDAVVQAVTAGDLTILVGKHSGLTSVQMHAPGEPADSATPPNPNSSSTEDGAAPSGKGQPPPALGKSGRHRSDVEHTGAMIALIPSAADAARLSVAGGEPADDLHVTLVYLGVGADFNDHARTALTGTIGAVVADVAPIVADGFALSVFNPGDDSDRQSCIVLGLGGDELAEIHTSVSEATTSLLALVGPDFPAQPDPWSPHLTLIYTEQLGRIAELVDRVGPVTFDRVRIVFAGSTIDIPLKGEPHRGVGWSPGLHPRDPHNGEFAHTPGSKLVHDLNGAIGGGHEPRGARFPREVTAESLPVAGGHIRFSADASQPGSVDLAVGAGKLRLRDRDEVESLRKGFIKAEYAEHDKPVYVTRNRGGRNEVIAAIRPGHAAENDSGETVHTAFELVPGGEPAATNHDEIDRAAGVGLSIKDTKRIIDAAERAQASRRLDSGNGTLDTFTPRPGAIAFRMSDERGNPTEVSFNAGEWRRISKAIDVVTDGFDESKIPNGASDDFEPPEISQLVVKTAAGRVQITWNGPRDTGHQYPNWYNPAASLIVVPLYDAPWGIAVDGDHMLDVLNSVGSVADVSGIARSVVIGK